MKRIYAILKGKLEDIKLNNKVKRVEAALNAAEINAESELIAADDAMSEAIESLKEESASVEKVIDKLQDALETKRTVKETLEDIKAIRDYLNEVVEEDKPTK
jgi:excinuclease UvrABC helicase subunit UvrB